MPQDLTLSVSAVCQLLHGILVGMVSFVLFRHIIKLKSYLPGLQDNHYKLRFKCKQLADGHMGRTSTVKSHLSFPNFRVYLPQDLGFFLKTNSIYQMKLLILNFQAILSYDFMISSTKQARSINILNFLDRQFFFQSQTHQPHYNHLLYHICELTQINNVYSFFDIKME